MFNTLTTAPLMMCRAVSVAGALAFLAEAGGTEEDDAESAMVEQKRGVMKVR